MTQLTDRENTLVALLLGIGADSVNGDPVDQNEYKPNGEYYLFGDWTNEEKFSLAEAMHPDEIDEEDTERALSYHGDLMQHFRNKILYG